MIRAPRIYLETTLFNYFFDEERDAHDDTVTLFEECAAGKYEAFTSTYAIEEIGRTKDTGKRKNMMSLIDRYGIYLLAKTDETDALARKYISAGALPPGSFTDACHIAVASIAGVDIIVSLNFSHIVKSRAITGVGVINSMNGYKSVMIESPMGILGEKSIWSAEE